MKNMLFGMMLLMMLCMTAGLAVGEQVQEAQRMIELTPSIVPGRSPAKRACISTSTAMQLSSRRISLYPQKQTSRQSIPASS